MIHFIKKLFGKEEIDNMKKFLVVGLGNIGSEYENTRHNIGFKALDFFAEKEAMTFEANKLGSTSTYKFKGRTFIFLKPATYMNLSGKAVKYWMTKEKIALENLLVITDDINLSFGTIRLKTKGSDGGHNGLKDIQNQLGTQNYARFRFGVGADFSKGRQVDYVLGEWSEEEYGKLKERLERAAELIKSFGTAGANNTMNHFNNT
ncbi:aminoacyl-tRNA hydrolase [Galbibacter pacificus]|uniref:Peptidyl-tRNA hydrolase n=1 Tax=Galbibacter pacificus TaxID=2996052 RepID=A0ABT6FT12_9FLAO|nr:aminoacyl-tRNA hydrolase [Galbibacter pacificus]MDG3582474.1 aminoacyl-tRNA hydrolase [Galbibacter pacificus]MDG3586408.1 aminoacyl-tRNA hydrolase [Galbibacter pacificus]